MYNTPMPTNEATFNASLVRDSEGRIIYTYRGGVERGAGGRYVWHEGFSPTTKDGGIVYPWMTKKECRHDAAQLGTSAVFSRIEPIAR